MRGLSFNWIKFLFYSVLFCKIFFQYKVIISHFFLAIFLLCHSCIWTFEPPDDKTNNVVVRPAKTQISLGIRPVWSGSSLSAWRNLGSLATHWAHSEDSDQTERMPRLIWVFAGRAVILLVLSRGGSFTLASIIRLNATVQNEGTFVCDMIKAQ